MSAGALARRRADEPRPPCRAGAWRCKRARPAVQLLRRAKLGQVAVLGLVNTAARPACQPERWRANALVCGAQRHKRARPLVGPPRRSKLKHVTVLGLVDTAARAACQPERVWGRARSGRRPRSGRAGAQRHKRARPAVRLPRRAKLRQVTVLGLADTAARAACQPERVWSRARSGRRPRAGVRRPAAHARLASRAAAAPLQTRAGDWSGPC